ncbi:MAG: ShlB/FhaC/HecB family hemolysin secretion/activation protein [Alphaproteobacteria bacterium]
MGSCAFSLILFASPAEAQVGNATTIADPSRAAQSIFDNNNLPELSENFEVTPANVQNAPDGAENITLNLKNIQIDGVSAYTADQLDPVYRSSLGQTITLADVYAIANTLTQKYRNDGYILTQVYIPPQTIEDGTVRLRVVEGFVDQIIIQGDLSEQEEKQIRQYADGLKRTGLLDAKEMERYLLLINDLPGVNARAILGKSTNVTGASDLTLVIERDAYDAEIAIDNHGSRYLGPYQASYNGSLNSVFGLNERITTQLAISGDKINSDELLFGSLGFELPISKYGTKISFNASKSFTEPGHDLEPFNVKGFSHFYSAKIEHPFIRSRTTNLFGRAAFDLRDVDSKNNLEPFTRKDRIRSARLGSTLQFMDSIFGVGANTVDLEYSQGLEIFGTSQKDSTIKTRALGDPQYKKLKFYGQRLQRVNSSVNLLLAGSGQWASAALLSSEEFGVGGMEFGRGYDSSEIVGDEGVSGKAELRWNNPKDFNYINKYQLYAFFDIGRVWNKDATTSAGKRDSLASTGLGIRADITDKIKAGVGVALPLTRERDTSNDNDPRYYFNISHKF